MSSFIFSHFCWLCPPMHWINMFSFKGLHTYSAYYIMLYWNTAVQVLLAHPSSLSHSYYFSVSVSLAENKASCEKAQNSLSSGIMSVPSGLQNVQNPPQSRQLALMFFNRLEIFHCHVFFFFCWEARLLLTTFPISSLAQLISSLTEHCFLGFSAACLLRKWAAFPFQPLRHWRNGRIYYNSEIPPYSFHLW